MFLLANRDELPGWVQLYRIEQIECWERNLLLLWDPRLIVNPTALNAYKKVTTEGN